MHLYTVCAYIIAYPCLDNSDLNALVPRMIMNEQVFGRGTGPTYALSGEFQCSGAETNLSECLVTIFGLDPGICFEEVIGVVCEGEKKHACSCIQIH